MGVEGCTKCIKYLLFVFNFIFWVSPSAVGVVGLRALLEPGFFHSFCPPFPHQPAPMSSFAPCYQGFGRRGAGNIYPLLFFLRANAALFISVFIHTARLYILA